MLAAAGCNVIFLPDNYAPMEPYTSELQQMGVEVLHHMEGGRTLHEALDVVLPLLDFAWISRPHLFEKYGPVVRRNRSLRLIYDTVDLSHVRGRRRAEMLGEARRRVARTAAHRDCGRERRGRNGRRDARGRARASRFGHPGDLRDSHDPRTDYRRRHGATRIARGCSLSETTTTRPTSTRCNGSATR